MITDAQIEKLRVEAGEHGDLEQVALCDIALGDRDHLDKVLPLLDGADCFDVQQHSRESARQQCAEAIEDARARHEEEAEAP